jgi:hypothetical protein
MAYMLGVSKKLVEERCQWWKLRYELLNREHGKTERRRLLIPRRSRMGTSSRFYARLRARLIAFLHRSNGRRRESPSCRCDCVRRKEDPVSLTQLESPSLTISQSTRP